MKSKIVKMATLKSPPAIRARLMAALHAAAKRRKAREAQS